MERKTCRRHVSPLEAGEPPDGEPRVDYAYVGRLPQPAGKGTFIYLAGLHALGTLGATLYLVNNVGDLYQQYRTRRFSMLLRVSAPGGSVPVNQLAGIVKVEELAPGQFHSVRGRVG